MTADFVYLASGSPRRRELLTQIGVPFRVLDSTVDESVLPGETAASYVTRLARAKAAAGREASLATPRPVVAADTTVVLDGRILGKPRDPDDGERMLLALSTRRHEVLTAVAVATSTARAREIAKARAEAGARAVAVDSPGMTPSLQDRDAEPDGANCGIESRLSRSEVTFRAISPAEARAYWATGEPCDKAGGYAVQGRAAVFITHLAGSYSGVMGLPLYETAELLEAAGVPRWR